MALYVTNVYGGNPNQMRVISDEDLQKAGVSPEMINATPMTSLRPDMMDRIVNADPNSPLGQSWQQLRMSGQQVPTTQSAPGGGVTTTGTQGTPATPTTTTATPPPTNPVDPNQPLSTPTTPINQSVAPSDISQFIPNASTQQQSIISQALDQSRGVGKQNVADLTDLYHKNIISQLSNWTDPNSPDYQATMGQLNNVGRADPNTFGQSLSSRLAPLISQSLTDASANALQPSFAAQQGMVGLGAINQGQLGLAPLQRYMQQQDFTQKSTLANQLADKGVPSNFDSGVGGASSFLNGLGNFGQGAAGLKDLTSYVCKELIRRDLLCDSDMDDFHVHIMPAMFKKGRAFWKYATDGLKLVEAVNKRGLDWSIFKPLLFDRVMAEKNPCKAVDLYADACRQLCIASDRNLWDERVMRTGVLDSLPFLPSLFAYQPFREALAKCIRLKMFVIYDKPRCEVHYDRS